MYSIVTGIVGAILILVASALHLLWNGKSLKDAIAWRIKLEQALNHGTHEVVDDWKERGLPLPVSSSKIEVELARARKQEKKMQMLRKLVIAAFYIAAAFFVILGFLLT